ncbi:ATP-binding protein [Mycoplasmopsis hyopharyngis]|uniref:ATP-binding protein n=1 Tax=Mycoplasmopsis hyopharyngis TaxID=29558 RepID=UPI0038737689
MFKRKIETKLYEYYNSDDQRIPIIKGARQIGKSYIIRATAKKYYKNYIEIDLKSDFEDQKLFLNIKSTKDFYILLSSLCGQKLNTYKDTIVFLDEIQFYPHLITLFKDLKAEKRFKFIASGSLLGITLKNIFVPMGSINEISMFPMDFEEFLWANNVNEEVTKYLYECFQSLNQINESIHQRILGLFQDYLIAGGLPAAVTEYVINKNVKKTREIQEEIFNYYLNDCSQYDIENKLKISNIYSMLLSQMSNKVKRIQFKKIDNKKNADLSKYSDEFDYLVASGISLKSKSISNPTFPLAETSSKNLIKFYYNDVGILTNLLYRNNIDALLKKDKGINLGSFYETVVAMELNAHGNDLFYFDSRKIGEVDFLVNDYDSLSVIPIEVKSGNDQNNFRAIPKLVDEKMYKLPFGYIFGNKNIVSKEGKLITLPIYMIMFINNN